MPRIILGILGGVGAGKSTVTRLLSELGARTVDADAMAHEVLDLPQVREQIRAWWGDSAFEPAGRVDRKAVAQRVFTAPAERARLEALIHPAVRERIEMEVKRFLEEGEGSSSGVLVLDVPLLASSPLKALCDVLVYVEAGPEKRAERIRKRGWSAEDLARREAAQTPASQKRAMAHHVIDNTGTLAECRRQVEELYRRLTGEAGRES